jgi:outer membrane protein, heavy metal efflux system
MPNSRIASRCCAVAALVLWAAAAAAQETTIATIASAVRVALDRSPAARPAELRREARLAERMQAGAWVNPEAGIDAENVAGSGAYRSAGSLELTGRVSQRFELGGKREARTGAAEANVGLADIELEIARLDIARNAATGLVEAVAASRAAALDRDRSRLAEDTLAAVRARIAAGREPPTATERAEGTFATARVAVARSAREAELARRRLALALGVATVAIADDPAWYADPQAAPALDATRAPQLAKADAELAKARAKLEQEVATAASDVTLSGGIRYYRETQDAALVVGLSVPIPVLNRNQGGSAAGAGRGGGGTPIGAAQPGRRYRAGPPAARAGDRRGRRAAPPGAAGDGARLRRGARRLCRRQAAADRGAGCPACADRGARPAE